jgi:uncharacterized membrane protein
VNNFSKTDLLKEAWELFKKNLNLLLGLIGVYLAYYIAQWLISYLFGNTPLASLLSLIFAILFLAIQLGAYNMILKLVDGKNAVLKDLYTYPNLTMKVVKNVVAGFLVGLAVVGGLILLIIPGIYIAVRLMFFTYYIIDKDAGIIDSLKMSWELTKNGVMNLFLLALIFLAINFVGAILVVGLAVTMPLTFLATALLYRKFQK